MTSWSTLALLSRKVESVDGIALLTFPKPCFACRRIDISPEEISEASKSFTLRSANAEAIRRTLTSPESFISGLSKPCAQFYPSFGLRLQSPDGSVVLLVFNECKTARLVTADRIPHEFLNIDPCIDRLQRILFTTGSP